MQIINPLKFITKDFKIINESLRLDIYGFLAIAVNKDYTATAFRLIDKVWRVVKLKNLKNKGFYIWVYEQGESVFAGIELHDTPNQDTELEQKSIALSKYAYYKHIGPYNLIKQVGQSITDELEHKGYETIFPYIEIYGHFNNDKNKLETEFL